jgi:hypothetical protein
MLEGEGFLFAQKSALNEKISISAASAFNSADDFQFPGTARKVPDF